MSEPTKPAIDGLPDWHNQITGGVRLGRAAVKGRCVVRGEAAAAAVCRELGLELPARINRATETGDAAVLQLGPDEWLVMIFADSGRPLHERLQGAAAEAPGSIVDVTQRQLGVAVGGSGACDALATCVPLDLDVAAFPIGMATRTIFEKAEIVLWRREADRFHIEAWRSFAPYVAALLEAARSELATGL